MIKKPKNLIPIAIDTETFPITRQKPSPKNICLTFCDGKNSGIFNHGQDTIEFIYEKLTNPNILLIGHNIAFDMCSLMTTYEEEYGLSEYIFDAYKNNRITDTGIRQQLFDIALGKSYTNETVSTYTLSMLWERLFNEKSKNFESKIKENKNSWRLRYSELYNLSINKWPKSAIDYAINDAYETFFIWKIQYDEAENYFRDDTFQTYSAFCLNLISLKGMLTSPSKVILFKKTQQRLYDELIPELEKNGLIIYDKKNKKWKKIIKSAQKLIKESCIKLNREPFKTKPSKKYPDGQIATDKKAIYWSENILLKKRIAFSAAEKNLTTYYPILRKGYELPITTRYKLAVTGRTTSSAPSPPLEGTNMQNQPKGDQARNCYIPREGNLFLAADISGAELHTFAQACKYIIGFSDLGDALNKGIDPHLVVAANVEGITYKEALKQYKKNNEKIAKSRFNGKMANFGFSGGMVGKTWALQQLERTGIVVDESTGNNLRKNWLRSWKEASKYLHYNQKLINRKNNVVFETFYSKRLTKTKTYCALCNRAFQCLAADGGKLALNEITRKCYDSGEQNILWQYNCFPVAWIHDELILEIPNINDLDIRQMIIDEFVNTMTEEFNKVVPNYLTKVEPVLMDCWNKDAKSIYDNEGHLLVWYENKRKI
jgi:DNA polymerase I